MPFIIHPSTLDDANLLSEVERSAAQAFRSIEALGWLADGEPMTEKWPR